MTLDRFIGLTAYGQVDCLGRDALACFLRERCRRRVAFVLTSRNERDVAAVAGKLGCDRQSASLRRAGDQRRPTFEPKIH